MTPVNSDIPPARPGVWVVDDSSVESEVLRRELSSRYEVLTFADAASMLEALAVRPPPATIVLDVQLPDVSGVEVCAFLRKTHGSFLLPILMLTVRGEKEQIVDGLQAGANDYVVKPFHALELQARVATLVQMNAVYQRSLELERARAQALAQARDERARLQTVIAHAPTGVCLLRGPDLVCEYVNPCFEALIGPGLRPGTPLADADAGFRTTAGLEASVDRVVASGEALVVQAVPIRAERRAGSGARGDAYVKLTYQPSRDEQGALQGVDIFAFDVTDRELSRRKLEELLSLASHELRTPVTSMLLQVQKMSRLLASPEQTVSKARLQNTFGVIERQARRQMRLVEDLLDVTNLGSTRGAIEPEALDVAEVSADVISRFWEDAGPKVLFEANGEVPAVLDRLRLEQILTNLISNAVRYGRGRPVTVSAQTVGTRRCRLTVRDEGIGIGPDRLDRIFDQFERAAPDKNYGGMGLGLWITRRLVEAMGGTVSVESTLDVGSTFTVELPRHPPAESDSLPLA